MAPSTVQSRGHRPRDWRMAVEVVAFTAPALIKDVAVPCGGSGGGRPDLAQAGGTNADGIDEAFAVLKKRIEQ